MAESSAPLSPFLQALPSRVRLPVPVRVRSAPDFTLMAAPSKASASAASVESSLAGSSLSVRVTLPEIYRVISVSLLQERGAVAELVSVRSYSTRVTTVVPFITVMLPSAQEPVIV